MAYEKPSHSLNQIGKAGKAILDRESAPEGIEVLNSWRVSHRYPLNALHMTLRNRAKRIGASTTSVIATAKCDIIFGRPDVSRFHCRACPDLMNSWRPIG